jgi:HEAT repeat protein
MPLLNLLENETHPQVRHYAVKALGKPGDRQAWTILRTIANDEHEMDDTRKAAQGALEKLTP